MAWSLIATALQSAAGLAVAIGLARTLGVAGFGQWGIINSTLATLGIFAGLGLGTTATKYVAELRDSDRVRLGGILALLDRVIVVAAGSVGIGLFLMTPLIAGPILQAEHLDMEFRIGCLLLFANALVGLETGVLAGFEAFRLLAIVNAVRAVVAVPGTIAAALVWGLAGAVAFTAGLALATWAMSLALSRRVSRSRGIARGSVDLRAEWTVLWHFSLPALLAAVMVGPPMWFANVVLVNQPGGYIELGAFTAANQWRFVVTFVPNVVGVATLPILASLLGQGAAGAPRVLAASIGLSALAAAPIAAVLIGASEWVMGLSGPSFAEFGPVLTVVSITSLLIASQMPIGSVITAAGRMWLGAAMNLGWSIVFVAAAAYLVLNGWGAMGLAVAYLVGYLVHGTWSFGFAFSRSWRGSRAS